MTDNIIDFNDAFEELVKDKSEGVNICTMISDCGEYDKMSDEDLAYYNEHSPTVTDFL